MTNYILLTIDVEDWFQVENFKPWIPYSSWSSQELRVEKNTHRLLDLFDSFGLTRNSQPSTKARWSEAEIPLKAGQLATRNPIRATFFVLGWLAKRLPHLVREIHARGHEVASHGYKHDLLGQNSLEVLRKDLSDSKKLLEDILGKPVWGYRAPNFAINDDTLKIIEECGYLYDSSYNSFAMHGRYGQMDFSQNKRKGIAIQISKSQHPRLPLPGTGGQAASLRGVGSYPLYEPEASTFYELPISNLKFSIQNPKSSPKNRDLRSAPSIIPEKSGSPLRSVNP
jgi:hypothetical protein